MAAFAPRTHVARRACRSRHAGGPRRPRVRAGCSDPCPSPCAPAGCPDRACPRAPPACAGSWRACWPPRRRPCWTAWRGRTLSLPSLAGKAGACIQMGGAYEWDGPIHVWGLYMGGAFEGVGGPAKSGATYMMPSDQVLHAVQRPHTPVSLFRRGLGLALTSQLAGVLAPCVNSAPCRAPPPGARCSPTCRRTRS